MKGDQRDVGSIMSKTVYAVSKNEKVITVARAMATKKISCAVIVDKKKPIGILTERDMIKKVIVAGRDPKKTPIGDVMTAPVLSLPPEAEFVPTAELMRQKKCRRFPITDYKGKLVGLVTQTDILEGIISLIKHLDWKLISMKISVEEYLNKLRESKIL